MNVKLHSSIRKTLSAMAVATLWSGACASFAQSTQPPNQASSTQSKDHRLEEALTDVSLLKRVVKEQDRRIAALEKTMRALQETAAGRANPAAASAAPAARERLRRPAWHLPDSWENIRTGMSRRDVEDILGPPTTASSVIDYQTLTYKGTTAEGLALTGSVKLEDDRVSQVTPPEF